MGTTTIKTDQGDIMRKHILRGVLLVVLLSSICTAVLAAPASALPATQAAPGELDTTFAGFGDNGVVIPPELTSINDMAAQPDDKLVVAGSTATNFQLAVYRYLPNGQLDATFDGDGKALVPDMFDAQAVALHSDGRIVVGGTRWRGSANGYDFQLARLTPNGALDPSFDGDGWAEDFDPQLTWLDAILVQPDAKILACGYAKVGGDEDFGVTRYNENGSRDNSFGGDGKVTIPFGGNDRCHDLALQNDGKLVALGTRWGSDDDFAVARLETDGTLDNNSNGDGGFDGDGKLTTGFGGDEDAQAVAIQPDGKIVVLGHNPTPGYYFSYIVRYLPSGALDGSFGSSGKRTIPTDQLFDLVLQNDGKLLALGNHRSDGDFKFALHRMLPSGAPDTTLDGDGIAWLDFGGQDEGRVLALQADGRILAAGSKDYAGGLLVRLWPDGTFDTGGQQTHGLSFAPNYQLSYRETVYGMALQDDGSFLVAGQVYNSQYTVGDSFLTRFRGDGRPDTAFGANGSAFIFGSGLNNNAARAVAVQPDGKIVIAGYRASNAQGTGKDFQVARFLPSGAIDINFGDHGVKLVDFVGGEDFATALALAPDGKIVVAGPITGYYSIWGVARLTSSGQLDSSFNQGGWTYVDFNGQNGVSAVAVQPDRKIILGGHFNGDFALHRLLENGAPDPGFGSNGSGTTLTNLGDNERINALALAANGWIYAAGYRDDDNTSGRDMALAQYTPQGILASCADPANCQNWPSGTFFMDGGNSDNTYALDLRGDNQLVAAGCLNRHFAAVQLPTDRNPSPLLFSTDFVGGHDCATAVKFSRGNTMLLAGNQELSPFSTDSNIALARFQTTKEVSMRDQAISMAPLPDRLISDAPFTLSASASSGLPVTFSSSSPSVCGVREVTLLLTGQPGICTITARQAGDATNRPAPEVTSSFVVRDPAERE
jgi:uncharacterized delta-60 repeat protein